MQTRCRKKKKSRNFFDEGAVEGEVALLFIRPILRFREVLEEGVVQIGHTHFGCFKLLLWKEVRRGKQTIAFEHDAGSAHLHTGFHQGATTPAHRQNAVLYREDEMKQKYLAQSKC